MKNNIAIIRSSRKTQRSRGNERSLATKIRNTLLAVAAASYLVYQLYLVVRVFVIKP